LSTQPGVTVEEQRADPGSTLVLCRELLALRRCEPDLHGGAYESLPAPPGVWAYRRGERFVVALNLSDGPAEVECPIGSGRIRLSTNRARDGEAVGPVVRLGAWEGVVLEPG
jgi:alpha-glucosidase